MKKWFMLTLVGKDQPGIVARVSSALFESGCNLGETSMTRLGGNFAIMMMVQSEEPSDAWGKMLEPVSRSLNLRQHVDEIEGELHRHAQPNVMISLYGADRAGIVAEVTTALANAGFNILNLESDVGGTPETPVYVMQIEGLASGNPDVLQKTLAALSKEKNVVIRIAPIDTLIG